MISINRSIIAATRPIRYAVDGALFRLAGNVEPLKTLRNRHRSQPMLVVGNGPSLNRTPLDRFAGIPSIGMNKIDLIYQRTAWRPELVVCLNNVVARQNQEAFVASGIPTFVAWKARWYLRAANRRKVSFFDTTLSNAFSPDPTKGFGSSATVTYIALQMAFWMGADPVILFGVDHSFHYAGPAQSYQRREGPDLNHFDPDYFKAGSMWGTPDLRQSEVDYSLARAAFEAAGRRVFDASIDGKLRIFHRIALEEAAALCGV